MKAIVCEQYGGPEVLKLKEVEKPTPKDDEVLVRVHAAAVNAADWRLMRADPFFVRFDSGFLKPNQPIPGVDIAGVVEAVGKDVTRLKSGDEVYGDLSECGRGGFAEYVSAPEDALQLKPANASFEEAAALPMAAGTALQALRDKGEISSGKQVLINGASGGVGSFLVQIAKAYGAEVTAVCSSRKFEFVKSLGADHVIDYKKENFTENGQKYDLIIAANGYHPLSAYKRSLADNGIYVCTGGAMKQLFQAMLLGGMMARGSNKTLTTMLAIPTVEDLSVIKEMVENGEITPTIDKKFPLAKTSEAIAYVEQGKAQGKVVITIAE